VNDRAVVLPTPVAPRYTVYPATPTLSFEADHEIEIDVGVAPVAERPPGAVGAELSAQAFVDVDSVVRDDRLPAASYASTPNVYVVPHVSPPTA
jgi:hypothetical protein